MKLADSEARKLLAFITATCRPRGEDQEREFEHWRKRLLGERA